MEEVNAGDLVLAFDRRVLHPELWAAIVYILMYAIREDLDRALRSLAAGRITVK